VNERKQTSCSIVSMFHLADGSRDMPEVQLRMVNGACIRKTWMDLLRVRDCGVVEPIGELLLPGFSYRGAGIADRLALVQWPRYRPFAPRELRGLLSACSCVYRI